MSKLSLIQQELQKLGLSSDQPPSAADWRRFLSGVEELCAKHTRTPSGSFLAIDSIVARTSQESSGRSAHSSLEEERDNLLSIISTIGEALCVLDQSRKVVYANFATERLTGQINSELIGQHTSTFVSDDVAFDRLLPAGGCSSTGSISIRRADNQIVPTEFTACSTGIAVDNSLRTVIVFRDVTKQREFEQTLQAARDQALEASKMKSDFLATMSHEIRTPINGILSYVELLKMGELTASQADDIESLACCAHQLRQIINDILDLSKIEAGKLYIDISLFSIRESVQSVMRQFYGWAKEKAITLEVLIDPEIPGELAGDRVRFEQILVNLLSNAMKFTSDGGRIEVSLSTELKDNFVFHTRLKVKDTGIGISLEKQSKIFEAFTQADSSTTRKHGGTGLGLTICSKLAELLDAKISLTSEVDVGTEIDVVFPFTLLDQMDGACDEILAEPNLASEIRSKRSKKILLAEDNVVNQSVISRILNAWGHSVEIAQDGQEAVERASLESFDLILMDIHMPRLDGIAATRKIRELNNNGSTIPIVALTAYATQGISEECLIAGMNHFIVKPIDYKELFKYLEKVKS